MQLQTTTFSSEKHVSHRVRAAIKLKHSFQMVSKFNLKISPYPHPMSGYIFNSFKYWFPLSFIVWNYNKYENVSLGQK